MKHLYLIRHAKSDWSDASKRDYARALNKRGKKAIVTMGEALKEKDIMPDLILSSSAKRAKLTAEGLAKEIGYKGKIEVEDKLYMADPQTVQNLVKELKNKYESVFVVGHNPETTELSNMVTDTYIDNVPTLGIVSLKLPIEKWDKLCIGKGQVEFFIYPKMFKS